MDLSRYFDYHATTPVDPRVLDAMLPYFTERFGNAASRNHAFGWAAAEAVDTARGQVAALIDARPSDAIALALRAKAPILVEESVVDGAKSIDFSSEKADTERLQKWLENLSDDDLGKYKM